MKKIKSKSRKNCVTKFGIWLWSDIAAKYAPTQHPLKDTAIQAQNFAKRTLKLPENLSGKAAFEIKPITVFA